MEQLESRELLRDTSMMYKLHDSAMNIVGKRHGRFEWSEARVVDRSYLIALVVRPEQESILDVRRNCKLLEDVVKDTLRTIGRQVGENDDDDVVVHVVTVSRFRFQQPALVAVHPFDNWYASVGDVLRSEPKCLTFQGDRHEGTDGPSAADEILVRLDDVGLDPVCDRAERIEIALGEFARSADVLEILEEEEMSLGLVFHNNAPLLKCIIEHVSEGGTTVPHISYEVLFSRAFVRPGRCSRCLRANLSTEALRPVLVCPPA